jgi:hypothetical protein
VIFWYGSGSADPYNRVTDPDPAIVASRCQDVKKLDFPIYFLKAHLHPSSKIKSQKESQNSKIKIKGFLTIFA